MINGIFKKMALIYKLFVLMALAVIGKVVYMQFINPTDTTAVEIPSRSSIRATMSHPICTLKGMPRG